MTTEIKRDLLADLAICDAATGDGKWELTRPHWHRGCYGRSSKQSVYTNGGRPIATFFGAHWSKDTQTELDSTAAVFTVEASEGWTYAIRRALAAEAEVERLRSALESAKYYVAREAFIPAEDVIDEALQEVSVNE